MGEILMQFGCCLSSWSESDSGSAGASATLTGLLRKIDVVFDAGFDFVELTVSSLMQLTAEEYDACRTALSFAPLPVFSCNSFIPPSLPIVGPTVDQDSLRDWVVRALQRVDAIGVQRVVFGSGVARSVPAGFSHEVAQQQIRDFLQMCDREAQSTDVVFVIEPLRRAETNVMNTVTDAAQWVEELGLSRVRLLADTYHMHAEGESLAVLSEVVPLLSHVHVANKEQRRFPGFLPSDADDMRTLIQLLDTAGYSQGVSVECTFDDFARETRLAIGCLRQAAVTT